MGGNLALYHGVKSIENISRKDPLTTNNAIYQGSIILITSVKLFCEFITNLVHHERRI